MIQWLDLYAFTAEGLGSIPGGRTKIPQVAWYSQKKKKSCLFGVTWGHADEVWMGTENLPHHPLAPPLPSFLGLHFSGRALHYPSPLLSAPNLTWPMNIHLS